MTPKFDIIIIGASTSGLHAALKLASAGKKVAVFDRQKELNPARRTLIVTPEMRKLLKDIPPEAILHHTGTMVLASRQSTAQVRLRDPDLIVERATVTRWLLSKAQAVGAQIFLGHRFAGFEPRRGEPPTRPSRTGSRNASNKSHSAIQVHFHNHGPTTALARETIIGADGINSDVAQTAGIPCPSSVSIVQAEVALPPGWDPDVTQVWFDTEDTRFFYWLIPESAEKAVAGLVGDEGTQTHRLLRAFLDRHNFKAEAYQGAKVALHHPRLRPWGKVGRIPVYLVGDAAGQVKVTTVGGTVTGIQGADAAVSSILNGSSYKAELRSLKHELDLHWFIRILLERLDNRGYDLLVGTISSRLRAFLARHNRDSMAPVFWQLPLVEPRLFQVAVKCLRGQRKSPKHIRDFSRFSRSKISALIRGMYNEVVGETDDW